MCHRSSSALRTRFHRGNDILKVYHYQVNHYTRKKESDERKRIQRHDFSGSSRKSSMVSFSFHSFTLVFIRVHPSNERTIPILAFRVHRVPSSAYIRFTSKKNSFIWRKRKWNDGIISYEIGLLPNSVLCQWKQSFLLLLSDKILMIRWNYAKKGTRSC